MDERTSVHNLPFVVVVVVILIALLIILFSLNFKSMNE